MELLINKNATRSGTIYDLNLRDVTPSIEGGSHPVTTPLIADSLIVGPAGEADKMLNSAHGTKGVPYESPIGEIALPKGAPMVRRWVPWEKSHYRMVRRWVLLRSMYCILLRVTIHLPTMV